MNSNWAQATPDYALLFIPAQVPGAPAPARWPVRFMRLFSILFLLVAVLAGCSSGLTRQEIQDITALVMRQTTNHVVGMERESSGEVTVWTAPLAEGTNGLGTTFTVRRQSSGWAVVAQKQERLND